MSRMHSDIKQTAAQGTISHMPPELIREGRMHKSTDVWSYGVLLWEMYSGQRAWSGLPYTQLMQAVGYEKKSLQWPDTAPADLKVRFQPGPWAGSLLGAPVKLAFFSFSFPFFSSLVLA